MQRHGTLLLWAVSLVSLLNVSKAQIMSVDLGHEFFKVALMRQGVPLEIVLNSHSKRKTTTAVSFFEAIRTFGDDALAHQGKAPAKVPMFFHGLLGLNFTTEDIKKGGSWWKRFGLSDKFYSYSLGYDEDRGVPTFMLSADMGSHGEEVLASILFFARKMSEDTSGGKPIRDLVVTIPSDASLRQRQAIVAAGEIAGLRVLTLVHEGSAFAVQRAVDFTPDKGASDIILFYNLGARKAEVTVVKFESRQAGMVAGKLAPVVTVLASAGDDRIGGHLMDLKIAEAMLAKFQEKFPKFASGVVENPRAMRKLLAQAQKTKAVLSSNKVAPFIVESLYEDTDFQATIKREDFEEMCKDMLAGLTSPIETALKEANVTMADITQVEVVGGAWRVPRVQQLLSEFLEKGSDKKLPLGQHLNGEEAAALGAALVAANASSSFRVKKIFFSDISSHEYAVQIVSADGTWEKNITTLYPLGTFLGQKKKVTTALDEDFVVKLFEDGVLLTEYAVTGVKELLEGKWKEYNITGPPRITATVPLETSGIVEVKTPVITVEETYWVNVTKAKPKPSANKTDSKDNATKEEKEKKDDDEADEEAENGSNASDSNETEYEVIQKQKKRKHEKKLHVVRTDYRPKPLAADQIADLRKKLDLAASKEQEVMAVAGLKNELEASIYNAREKLEHSDFIQVSTEEQREEISKLCSTYEEWVHEAGSSKSDFESRIQKMQDLIGPVEERLRELEARADIPDLVEAEIKDIKKIQAHVKKNMSWVPENKTEPAEKKLAEFQEWWAKKQEQQKKLPLHEAPAYTRVGVMERLEKVSKEWEKIQKLKKPKETKPAKTKSKDEKSSDKEAKGKEDAKEEGLSSDPSVIEKELAEVREKKAAAVESEDFDGAESLKKREKALLKQLEKLKGSKSEL